MALLENNALLSNSSLRRFPQTAREWQIFLQQLNQQVVSASAQGAEGGAWYVDTLFTASDANTVTWDAGSLILANGNTYSIDAGTTGNMAARTYVYFDLNTSTTEFQLTTTGSDTVGSGKLLIAVAEDASAAADLAFFQVFGGIGGTMLTANEIATNSITANEIAANTITATEIASTITWTQNLIISTGGNIRQGKTSASSTTAGFWLGSDGVSSYDFHIGNPTSYFWWDGSAGSLTVQGNVGGVLAAADLSGIVAANTVATASIQAAAVENANIANLAVQTANIALNAVTEALIANNAVGSDQIQTSAVTANEILSGTITSAEIAAATITGSNIAANTITGSNIQANTITASDIQSGTITATEIAAGTITATEIQSGTITASQIASGTITSTQIASNTIIAGNIAAGAVDTSELAAGAVTATEIASGTITATQISAGTITASELASTLTFTQDLVLSTNGRMYTVGKTSFADPDDGVYIGWDATEADYVFIVGDSTSNIAYDGTNLSINGVPVDASDLTGTVPVSATPISTQSWSYSGAFSSTDADTVSWGAGTLTLADGTTYSIGAGNTGNMVAATWIYFDADVSTTAFQTTTTPANTTGENRIAIANARNSTTEAIFQVYTPDLDAVLSGSNIESGSVSSTQITAGTITSSEIASGTIVAGNIASGTITSGEIASGTITAGNIASGTITATQIAAGTITSSLIAANTIVAGDIAASTITGTQISSLSISGKTLTADTGTIAGWTISSSTLYHGSGSSRVGLTTGSVSIYCGHETPSSAPFRVTNAGALVATNATITGAITATSGSFSGSLTSTSGTIGGWTLSSGALTSGSLRIESSNQRIEFGSATGPTTGTGIWIGLDGSDYEFRAGNPAGDYIHWNGSTLTIEGDISANLSAGDWVAASTFSPSWSGFSSAPSGTLSYSLSEDGNKARFFTDTQRTGTSNATSCSFSNLPSAVRPPGSTNIWVQGIGMITDSSGTYIRPVGLRIWGASHGSAGTVEFFPLISTGQYSATGWTNSGTKGLLKGFWAEWSML